MTPQDTRTGSVSARVISASIWVFGSQILSLVLVFVAQRLVLSSLDPESNGTLFLERRITEVIVGLLADFGMNGIVVRRVAQDPSRATEILSSAFYVRLTLWSACTLAVTAAGWASTLHITDVLLWCVYMLIASRAALLRYTLETRLRAASDFRLPSLLAVLDAAIFAALITLWRSSLTPTVVIQAFVLSALPGFLILLFIDKGRSTTWSKASRSEMASIVREALPVVSATLLIAVHDKIDAFIVESFAGRAHVGILGAAYTTLGPLLAVIPMAVSYAAMPDVARLIPTDEGRGLDVAMGVMKHLLVISLLVTSVATVVMPVFVDLVTKGRYLDSVNQFIWFVWSAPFVAVLVYAQELSVAIKRQKNLVRIATVLVASTVGFGLLLIPSMQSLGAVIAKIITSVVGAAVSLWLLHATLGTRLSLMFMLRMVVLTGLCAGASLWLIDAGGVTVLSSAQGIAGLLGRMVVAVIAVLTFATGLGVLGRDDLRRLRNGFVGAR
ncbi:MAG: oligosaccharide flippase family protein [Candidatus Kapaibacterium sp.]